MSANLPIPAEFAEIAAICVAAEGMIGNRSALTVNARDLHTGLQVRRDFSNWIKGRVSRFGFVEHQDFESYADLSSPDLASPKARAQETKEYRLTLDMAKELSMVENNEKGRLARRYFIWREQQALSAQHNTVTIADIEQNMRSVMGGINKRVLGKGLEPVISTLEAQNTHMRLLEAKLDQALILLDRPAPNPNTIVAQHKVQRQEEGDDILVVKALQQLGGKATPRTIMRRLGTARWNASRRDAALASLIESGHVVIEQALTKPSPGRPTMDMVRLVQAPFHQTPA